MKKIMIDPGHGGRDPGAIGPTGVQEKIVNLSVAQLLAGVLKPMADVRLTREDNRALGATLSADLQARADMANDWDADIFVSIHCNSSENRAAHGAEVYTTPGHGQCDILAESIIKAMEAQLPELHIRKDLSDGDSDKEAWFAVLWKTKMSAVLVELAFISNPTEEALMESPAFQARAARVIAEGIAGYLGVQLPATDPNTVRIVVAGRVLTGKLIDGRTYAPVRVLAEALGRTVEWDEASRTVKII